MELYSSRLVTLQVETLKKIDYTRFHSLRKEDSLFSEYRNFYCSIPRKSRFLRKSVKSLCAGKNLLRK